MLNSLAIEDDQYSIEAYDSVTGNAFFIMWTHPFSSRDSYGPAHPKQWQILWQMEVFDKSTHDKSVFTSKWIMEIN